MPNKFFKPETQQHIQAVVSVNPISGMYNSAGLATQKFLTITGNGLGAYNFIGDYSAIAIYPFYQADSLYELHSLLVVICGNEAFNQTDYGTIVGGLTNGIKFLFKPNGLPTIPLLSSVSVKQNFEYLLLNHEVFLTSFNGTPQTLTVNFDIVNDYGKPIVLEIGDVFMVELNDNFTTLVAQTFGLRGIKY